MKLLLSVFHITPGTYEVCKEIMEAGHLLAIGPGLLLQSPASFGSKRGRLEDF